MFRRNWSAAAIKIKFPHTQMKTKKKVFGGKLKTGSIFTWDFMILTLNSGDDQKQNIKKVP